MDWAWISRYDTGVPGLISYSDRTMPDFLQCSATRAPDSIALFFYGARNSYGDLDDLTTRLVMALLRLGVRQGDHALWATARHHQGLARNQLLMTLLVKAGAHLFSVEGLVWHASQPAVRDRQLADMLVQHFYSQVKEAFHPAPLLSPNRLLLEDDSQVFHLAQDILAGKGEWPEDGILPWHSTRQRRFL